MIAVKWSLPFLVSRGRCRHHVRLPVASVVETGIQEDLLSNHCQFSSCFSQTWAFLSGIRWIWVVILGRKLSPARLLKSACCWGRPTPFCSLLFSVFFCSGGVWRPFGFFSICFGACNQVWRSVVTHQPDGEVLSELLSLRFKVSFLAYRDLLRPVFTVFAQIRCVWNVMKQYALKMVCPGYPPQCHSLFLDFFFFSFCVDAMYMIQDAQ